MYLGLLNIKLKKIQRKSKKDYNNLYEIIQEGVEQDYLLEIGGGLVYFRDIQVDYKSKEIYVLVFKQDGLEYGGEVINYNKRFEKEIIHSYKDGYKIKYLNIIDYKRGKEFKVKIEGKSLSRLLREDDLEAKDIFRRYIRQSYGRLKDTKERYKRESYYKLDSKIKEMLKEKGLNYYGKNIREDYRDVRRWKLDKLRESYTDEELGVGIDYDIKRIEFELEIYTRNYENIAWNNWRFSDDEISNSWKGRNKDYKKYKENDISLIYKKRWEKEVSSTA